MKCKKCKGESKVIEVAKDKYETYRLRKCKVCGERFYTVEQQCNYYDGYEAIRQIRNFKRKVLK